MEWIKKKLSDLWMEILGGLILLGLGTGATIWAIVLDWGPVIILIASAFVVLGIFTVNQLYIVKQRSRRGLPTNNNKIRSRIREWLDSEHYKVQSVTLQGEHFRFTAEDNIGRQVIVARPKGELEDFIIIGGSWKIPPEYHDRFDNMSEDIKQAMLEELKMELLRLKVDYQIGALPLRQVGVESRIACDETTSRLQFLQLFGTIKYANVLITVILEKGLRLAGYGPDSIPDDGPNQPSTPDKEGSQT